MVNEIYDKFEEKYPDTKEENSNITIKMNNTNVVSGEVLRKIQSRTLKQVAEYISHTFGPMGSNTKIITGANRENLTTAYSKDGLKVLKHIMSSDALEMSIIEELIEITRSVEKEVGDGTTSTVILSSFIFDNLIKIQERNNLTPYNLIRKFKSVVKKIKDEILTHKIEFTADLAYDIAMISTNGNEDISDIIKQIYTNYGTDVDISLGISNTSDNQLKIYDGLLITEGFSDAAYINNPEKNTAEIPNAHIYYFKDPINTMDMIGYFESILKHNIYDPMELDGELIPTVICCPSISRDLASALKRLVSMLYSYNDNDMIDQKPPILIITDIVASDETIMADIADLCGCRVISKYIDPEQHQKDIEAGLAPTYENVWEFYGTSDMVIADNKKTKFINPPHAKEGDPIYSAMINFLETEIKQNDASNNANESGALRKRLAALKGNMVEYLVGGATVADRDAAKDLIEDAIKNCKSASLYGVGYAANFEGLRASSNIYNFLDDENIKDNDEIDICAAIFNAYFDTSMILYGTVSNNEETVIKAVVDSIENDHPFNISCGYISDNNDSRVYSSIMLDINILDTLSKIITIMVTCNQCTLQAPNLNNY